MKIEIFDIYMSLLLLRHFIQFIEQNKYRYKLGKNYYENIQTINYWNFYLLILRLGSFRGTKAVRQLTWT